MAIDQVGTDFHPVTNHGDFSNRNASREVVILIKYGTAIRKSFGGLLKNDLRAAELYRNFALKLLRGEYDLEKDRIPLRQVLQDYTAELLTTHLGPKPHSQATKFRENFQLAWRQALLESTWQQLKSLQEQNGKQYYTVFKARIEHPNLSTAQLHVSLMGTGQAVSSRQAFKDCLQRARSEFSKILFAEVLSTLNNPTDDDFKSELQLLGLHHFTRASKS